MRQNRKGKEKKKVELQIGQYISQRRQEKKVTHPSRAKTCPLYIVRSMLFTAVLPLKFFVSPRIITAFPSFSCSRKAAETGSDGIKSLFSLPNSLTLALLWPVYQYALVNGKYHGKDPPYSPARTRLKYQLTSDNQSMSNTRLNGDINKDTKYVRIRWNINRVS